jgi:hypothetical protein
MGLTVHYTLHAEGAGHEQAQELVAWLHEFACDAGYPVSELYRYDRDEAEPFFIEFPLSVDGRDLQLVPQVPAAWFQFQFPGADMMTVGLARLELSGMQHLAPGAREKLACGHHFWAFCKTQFALLRPEGSRENFLAAHKAVIAVLDKARELGMEVEVRDESEYWVHRDEVKLLAYAEKLGGLIAATAGFLKDKDLDVASPVLGSPCFEQMEARGRKDIEEWEKIGD